MIKKFESQFNGTKEMSEKHFIDPEILSSFLKENIPNFSGQLEIQEFIGGQSNPTYFLAVSYTHLTLPTKRIV